MHDTVPPIVLALRDQRHRPQPLIAANPPRETILPSPPQGSGLALGALVALGVFLGTVFFNTPASHAFYLGLKWGIIVACLYWLWPGLECIFWLLVYRRWPDKRFLSFFTASQKWITCAVIAFGLTLAFDLYAPVVLKWWQKSHPAFHYITYHPLLGPGYREYFDFHRFLDFGSFPWAKWNVPHRILFK